MSRTHHPAQETNLFNMSNVPHTSPSSKNKLIIYVKCPAHITLLKKQTYYIWQMSCTHHPAQKTNLFNMTNVPHTSPSSRNKLIKYVKCPAHITQLQKQTYFLNYACKLTLNVFVSIFRYLQLEVLAQYPAANNEKYVVFREKCASLKFG